MATQSEIYRGYNMQLITILTLVLAIILFILIYRVRGNRIAQHLLVSVSLVVLWQFLEFMSIYVEDLELFRVFQELGFIPLFLVSPILFIVALDYSGFLDRFPKTRYLVYLIPLISVASLFIDGFPYQFFEKTAIRYNNGIPIFLFTPGTGFTVHTTYSFLLTVATVFVIAIVYKRSQKMYKRQNLFMIVGTAFSLFANFFVTSLTAYNQGPDITAFFTLITIFVFYVGIFRLTKSMITPIAQDMMIENLEDMAVIVNQDCQLIYANTSALTFFNDVIDSEPKIKLTKSNYRRRYIKSLFPFLPDCSKATFNEDSEDLLEYQSKTETYYFRFRKTILKDTDQSVMGYVLMFQDVTEKKLADEKVHQLAYVDELTSLGNKNSFFEHVDRSIKIAEVHNESMILLVDLDGFDVVNDSLGYSVGDNMLSEIAQRLNELSDKDHHVYRYNGDVFAIVVDQVQSKREYMRVVEDILIKFNEPVQVESNTLSISASIGVSLIPEDGLTREGLIRKATAALHSVKKDSTKNYQFSNSLIEEESHRALKMQLEMEHALRNREFELFLQPQIQKVDHHYQVVGAEALIRWFRNNKVLYRPDQFIELAEMNGMIIPIGQWVVDEIYRINKDLVEAGIQIKLSINVSSNQLNDGNFVEYLKKTHQSYCEVPIDLVVEVTESVLLSNIDDIINKLNSIKELGIGLALDDFGTGYSSLSYLKTLPIDFLKIDKMFIDDIVYDSKNLTSHIISMAKTLGMLTIAEGVEDQEQLGKLMKNNIDLIQGYHFSKPLRENDFIDFVNHSIL